jgi:hypothetical protein
VTAINAPGVYQRKDIMKNQWDARYFVCEPTPWDDAKCKPVCQVFGSELLGGAPPVSRFN